MSKVKQTLEKFFEEQRIVFWYDDNGTLKEEYDALQLDGVEKVQIDNNEFTLKYRMLKEEPKSRFLVYAPYAQPEDEENWLLDLLLAHRSFSADKTSLILTDLGLDQQFKTLVAAHLKFFNAPARVKSLAAYLTDAETEESLMQKMIAVAINADVNTSSIVYRLLENGRHISTLQKLELDSDLWKLLEKIYAYSSEKPGMEDFTYKLLQNHFYWSVDHSRIPLNREAMLFVKQWMDSKKYGKLYKEKAGEVAEELRLEEGIETLSYETLKSCDTYEQCERAILSGLMNRLMEEDTDFEEIDQIIAARENTCWYDVYVDLYQSLHFAARLILAIRQESFSMSGFHDGIEKYVQQWQKIDYYYRKYITHRNRAEHAQVLKALSDKIDDIYLNGFLRKVNENFNQYIEGYAYAGPFSQRGFFDKKIQPFIDKEENAIVIISDALRYECGMEMSDRISGENRFTTQMEYMTCSLPSYTQLGMASLLPHKQLELRDSNDTVFVDGRSSSGMANRSKILQSHCAKSIAIGDEEFLALGRDEGRAFVKENKIIYIYHNEIDATGDKLATEEKVFEAVESSFTTLMKLIKQALAFNRQNIFITADHGFLYHNTPTKESEFCKFEDIVKPLKLNRRFIIGKELKADNCTTKFSSGALGIEGDNDILLAKSINKMRVQGGGNRFVHGAASLQELVIPLITIRKKRKDDTRPVEVQVMALPRITTNTVAVSLYQEDPITEKIQPITLKAAFYSKDGELLTQVETVTFDSTGTDSRTRETKLNFLFKQNIEQYNNQTIQLVLKKVLSHSTEEPVYKSVDATLKLSMFNDFGL